MSFIKHKNKKAFTLAELGVVIVSIGILLAIVSKVIDVVDSSKLAKARSLTASSPVGSIKGLTLWLETTSQESFDKAQNIEGTQIATWYDINPQSIDKNDATAASTQRPLYISDAINGLPALRFDDVNDFFTVANESNFDFSNLTIFAVVRIEAFTASWQAIVAKGDSAWRLQRDATASRIEFAATSTVSFNVIFPSEEESLIGNPTILSAIQGVSSKSIYRDGLLKKSQVSTGTMNTNNYSVTIGANAQQAGREFSGDIAEVIIYNRELNDDEREDVESYLSQKWGIMFSN
ncbi:MAG: hypothetical protein O3B09_01305 [Proteobacteria bacterium]|nr:hypothetical protein [Pseudomonadota bacterium]